MRLSHRLFHTAPGRRECSLVGTTELAPGCGCRFVTSFELERERRWNLSDRLQLQTTACEPDRELSRQPTVG